MLKVAYFIPPTNPDMYFITETIQFTCEIGVLHFEKAVRQPS